MKEARDFLAREARALAQQGRAAQDEIRAASIAGDDDTVQACLAARDALDRELASIMKALAVVDAALEAKARAQNARAKRAERIRQLLGDWLEPPPP